jgi:hypothetical protein
MLYGVEGLSNMDLSLLKISLTYNIIPFDGIASKGIKE